MAEILLTQGKRALVDTEDYPRLSKYRWRAKQIDGLWYAYSANNAMHRELLTPGPGVCVDHINHDGLDNRRENLRLASHAENMANKKRPCTNKSGFKGVSFAPQLNKWYASIKIHGKSLNLGYYLDKIAAANAYDEAAKHHFGNFAHTNRTMGLLE
jgi:hypothetical protein